MPYRILRLEDGFVVENIETRQKSRKIATRDEAEIVSRELNGQTRIKPHPGKLSGWYQKAKPSEYTNLPTPPVTIATPTWIEDGMASKIAQAAYEDTPPPQIGSYRLVKSTPTLKFYRLDNTVIVSVRGTKDQRDVASWTLVATSSVKSGARFQEDARVMAEFKTENEMEDLNYYAVGHSLGGAIIDVFLRDEEIIAGISFNPAIQVMDLQADLNNLRIYHVNDPLYMLMGHLASGGTVVVGRTEWWEKLLTVIPYYGKLYQVYSKLQAHKIQRFL